MVTVPSHGPPPLTILQNYTDNSEVRLETALRLDYVQESSDSMDVGVQFGPGKGQAFKAHSVLLQLAFPAIANMDFRPGSRIIIADSCKEEVSLMLELAYGYGRSVKQRSKTQTTARIYTDLIQDRRLSHGRHQELLPSGGQPRTVWGRHPLRLATAEPGDRPALSRPGPPLPAALSLSRLPSLFPALGRRGVEHQRVRWGRRQARGPAGRPAGPWTLDLDPAGQTGPEGPGGEEAGLPALLGTLHLQQPGEAYQGRATQKY